VRIARRAVGLLETCTVTSVSATFPLRIGTPLLALSLSLAMMLAGCTFTTFSGDTIDYRSQSNKIPTLEVPPDLTQLARDSRYQPQSGVISAAALQQGARPAVATEPTKTNVALNVHENMRIDRAGETRWLVTSLPPEKLYPLLRPFWTGLGFGIAIDDPKVGVMETDWAENRANVSTDFIRSSIGKFFDSAYSTSERDKYRTRVERTETGSEVFIVHRGMIEVYTTEKRDQTAWQPRPTDHQLEAEFLTRLMISLGSPEAAARTAVAAAKPAPSAPKVASVPSAVALELGEGFDRAWRQVGLALDRSGFTVEDRDRAAGLYFVRYVDPKSAGKDDPNFITKLFSSDKDPSAALLRYRVVVKSSGATSTTVSVQNSQGAADGSDAAKLIIARLTDEIR
jgi:outer membrane protein assembly factor BamC